MPKKIIQPKKSKSRCLAINKNECKSDNTGMIILIRKHCVCVCVCVFHFTTSESQNQEEKKNERW